MQNPHLYSDKGVKVKKPFNKCDKNIYIANLFNKIKMKALRVLSILLILTITPAFLFAQIGAEKKKLKKELRMYRKMKPMEIRSMKMNYDNKLKDKKNQELIYKQMQRKYDSLQNVLNANNSKMSQLEVQLLQAQAASLNAKPAGAKGYYYRVQLGAYKFYDIKSKNASDESFSAESTPEMDKMTVGLFYTLAEADQFKEDVRRMGIKDAYVVPFKDGKRVTHKEAAEGLKKSK